MVKNKQYVQRRNQGRPTGYTSLPWNVSDFRVNLRFCKSEECFLRGLQSYNRSILRKFCSYTLLDRGVLRIFLGEYDNLLKSETWELFPVARIRRFRGSSSQWRIQILTIYILYILPETINVLIVWTCN